MNDLIGQSLGRYHIIEKLGEGGMATVYKAYDTRLERDVAVKIIRKEAFSQEVIGRILKRFEREAKTLAKLTHPNIVSIIDYGEHENSPYLVMPYLAGGTLKGYMGKPMPWQEAIRLLLPIARALDYAHSQDVIHRDVKPANILITTSGEPMLTDFGIAKMLDLEGGQTLTGTGVGIGTPEYMAPEQGMGKEIDGRADIYSLGVILYELVTGRKPFTADTPMAVVFKHMTDPLPRPGSLVDGLPEGVEKVIIKALAKDPADRYQSMGELAGALKKLESTQPGEKLDVEPSMAVVHQDVGKTDTFATVDQLEPSLEVHKPKLKKPEYPDLRPLQQQPAPEDKKSFSVGKFLGFGLGGIALLLVLIGVSSGWFTEIFFSTSAPPITEAPAATEMFAETVAATEIPTVSTSVAYDIGSTMVSEVDGMTLVYVPEGEFIMGRDEHGDEFPQHQVYLDAYWIDQTEVTNAMYEQCVNAGVCTQPHDLSTNTYASYFGNSEYSNYPVTSVDWSQAKTYCEWSGRQLPTEAQWEKAARGINGLRYPWGESNSLDDLLNHGQDVFGTTPVGSYPKGVSPYGALDMAGNVWEWVGDWYGDYSSGTVSNPTGPSYGEMRIMRGGSFSGTAIDYYRGSYRFSRNPTSTDANVGFRCVRNTSVSAEPSIGSTKVSEVDGMTLVYVPEGEFSMGSPEGVGEDDEHPQHQVYLDAYWIDQTEVTNAMYEQCVNDGQCSQPHKLTSYASNSYYGNPENDNYPVIYVDWTQAQAYCLWAGRELPTEAQWEKAGRGTDGRTYPWGDDFLCDKGNFDDETFASPYVVGGGPDCDGFTETAPVGSFPLGASPYGALDMSGNVWEWVADWYGAYPSGTVSNPTGPASGEYRILRGDSWVNYIGENFNSAHRNFGYQSAMLHDIGFRCVLPLQ